MRAGISDQNPCSCSCSSCRDQDPAAPLTNAIIILMKGYHKFKSL